MANEEQLEILQQGFQVWNTWREENPQAEIDISRADLKRFDLRFANLSEAHIEGADLREADLKRIRLLKAKLNKADLSKSYLNNAYLEGADLTGAHLERAVLKGADLRETQLGRADLRKTNLSNAQLNEANLVQANLMEAQLIEADLTAANLCRARLTGSNFFMARVGYTIFGTSDLSEAVRLQNVVHHAPSSLSTDSFAFSKGEIPEIFLRGCGLSDWEIESAKLYNPDWSNEEINTTLYKIYDLRAQQALQISPLFISYSHSDSSFVNKIEDSLNRKGIRFWRDVHDLKSGRIETQIDHAIRQNPTVLLILSAYSVKSDWVEYEVRTARELGKELGRDTLCPVALDDSWKDGPWPKRVMEQVMEYNILDFSEWKDDSKFGSTFNKLIDGLELFYKG